MAGQFPLAIHAALDVAVCALLPAAQEAEADLAKIARPEARRRAMELLRSNGALRARRRVARSAAGLMDDTEGLDGHTWDAPDVDGCF
jgi:hypothetical protein